MEKRPPHNLIGGRFGAKVLPKITNSTETYCIPKVDMEDHPKIGDHKKISEVKNLNP